MIGSEEMLFEWDEWKTRAVALGVLRIWLNWAKRSCATPICSAGPKPCSATAAGMTMVLGCWPWHAPNPLKLAVIGNSYMRTIIAGLPARWKRINIAVVRLWCEPLPHCWFTPGSRKRAGPEIYKRIRSKCQRITGREIAPT